MDSRDDSDRLDAQLQKWGIDMIAPHRGNRIRNPTQDGRKLRRYRHRWKVERLFAWLGNFRRLAKDYEVKTTHSEAVIYISSAHLLSRRLAKAKLP